MMTGPLAKKLKLPIKAGAEKHLKHQREPVPVKKRESEAQVANSILKNFANATYLAELYPSTRTGGNPILDVIVSVSICL